MVAAGAGIAPFRAFVQERAVQMAGGRRLEGAVLFFGCRGVGDDLYREEMDAWEGMRVVKVRRAYSRAEGGGLDGEGKGCRYVQGRVWREREEVWGLWERGAKIFVCGSRGVSDNVKGVVVRMAVEAQREKVERGESAEEASEAWGERWFEGVRNTRYVMDVFD